MPSGSTSRSKRRRKASRAGRVRALRSVVRLHEISAAIWRLMSLPAMAATSPRSDAGWLSQRLSWDGCSRVYVQTRAQGVR